MHAGVDSAESLSPRKFRLCVYASAVTSVGGESRLDRTASHANTKAGRKKFTPVARRLHMCADSLNFGPLANPQFY